MGFDTDLKVFLIYAVGIIAVYFAAGIFAAPVKIMIKLIVNSVLGSLLMLLINSIGFGVIIPVNFITAVIAGTAGIPGIAMMLIYYQNIL